MEPEVTATAELSVIVNSLFAMPSAADAGLLYGLGWSLVLVPFLLGWVTVQIAKALQLFRT